MTKSPKKFLVTVQSHDGEGSYTMTCRAKNAEEARRKISDCTRGHERVIKVEQVAA